MRNIITRRISTNNFIGEIELTVGRARGDTEASFLEKGSERVRKISRKLVFKKSDKKNYHQSTLFLSPKFVNSLKKVGFRKKKGKLENNNFLYQRKGRSLINDEDFQMVKDLPLIPFSPNQLQNFSEETRSCRNVKSSLKFERRTEHHKAKHRNLDSLLSEARTELNTARTSGSLSQSNSFPLNDYVLVSNPVLRASHTILSDESDYIEMNSIVKSLK